MEQIINKNYYFYFNISLFPINDIQIECNFFEENSENYYSVRGEIFNLNDLNDIFNSNNACSENDYFAKKLVDIDNDREIIYYKHLCFNNTPASLFVNSFFERYSYIITEAFENNNQNVKIIYLKDFPEESNGILIVTN